MLIGHLGVGLALKKTEPKINVGWLFFMALFFDFLLGIFVLLGLEQVQIPENYDELQKPTRNGHSILLRFHRSGPRFLDSSLRSYFPRHQATPGSLMDS